MVRYLGRRHTAAAAQADAGEATALRVGLLYPKTDPVSPAHWSGTPCGLRDGFSALGVEVIPIGCQLPPLARAAVAVLARARGARGVVAHREPVYARARAWALAHSLRRAGPLDALVAMGTDLYDLPVALRAAGPDTRGPRAPLAVATFDDGNFGLFLRHADADLTQAGYPTEQVLRWAQRQAAACRVAQAACVSTAWAARSWVDDYSLPAHQVHVVGMGHRPRRQALARRQWHTPRFLFVGVDWRRKNGAAVVEAFGQLRLQWPEATLDLVGEHPPLSAPGVRGHGFLPREDARAQARLDALYAQATAFVLPSRFDPAGIAYLEAASAGLPVIATTCGGASELLQDAALTVDPDDHPALLRAMRQLADPDMARTLGQRAAARAAQSTWPAVASRILACLTTCPSHPVYPGATPRA